MSATVTINCDGICCDSTREIVLDDWSCRIGGVDCSGDSSYLYCNKPECREQEKFFGAQCPGCVAGYPDCGLGRAFAYSHAPGLKPDERVIISRGRCPFRINGTFSMSYANGFKAENLSELAPDSAGLAVLAAIDAYAAKYGDKVTP